MGSKGIVASTAALSVLLQEGIGDTIRISLTPEPGGDRTQEVIVAQEILQTMGLRSFTPMVTACPGCGRTTSTTFQELASRIQSYLRASMPVWRARYPGVEDMQVAVMGCVVNGPGESKLANIGISLPGTGESPVAPVYVDGQKTVTLRGERIAEEFQQIVDDYVRATWGGEARTDAARSRAPHDFGEEPGVVSMSSEEPVTTRGLKARTGEFATRGQPAKLQAVRGMNDVLPDEAALWERFEDTVRDVFALYGYRNLRVPIVEPTPLFVRAIGEATDVVEKEMYTFEDQLSAESLTLRPEATAGIVRAAIEHNLIYERPQRVWLAGPMFRHERPQKGRYRQFHQFDVEALGFPGPDVDAEQMILLARLWRELGLDDRIRLTINSIGDADERRAHRAALIEHFERHASDLDEDARRRLHSNPLRILDSKTRVDAVDHRGCADASSTASGRRRARISTTLQALLDRSRHRVRDEPAAGARSRLLQSHGLRVGHRPAGGAGHGRGRRSLRRPVRAARRQADAGVRIRHGHRAHDPAAPGCRVGRREGAARLHRPRR